MRIEWPPPPDERQIDHIQHQLEQGGQQRQVVRQEHGREQREAAARQRVESKIRARGLVAIKERIVLDPRLRVVQEALPAQRAPAVMEARLRQLVASFASAGAAPGGASRSAPVGASQCTY